MAYQLIDDVLDFTGTSVYLEKGSLSDIKQALDFLFKSSGIEKTKLAKGMLRMLAKLSSHFESGDEDVIRSRRALVDLTFKVITR
ncbi:hypothetical protein HPP92_001916 [Vanilla planifolia]|uniref:Uncharacterized protein n=1 Tax=Vanilla planifolia TaxID=51239 RepID=A0A835S0N2_VANPL|nr:hypothetical protein HPP92_001916 [Vanilla planifolia]